MAGKILGTTVYYDADCNLGKLEGKKIIGFRTCRCYGECGVKRAKSISLGT
mgnify:CR=1 FL=1